jgi:hypothetical protein
MSLIVDHEGIRSLQVAHMRMELIVELVSVAVKVTGKDEPNVLRYCRGIESMLHGTGTVAGDRSCLLTGASQIREEIWSTKTPPRVLKLSAWKSMAGS